MIAGIFIASKEYPKHGYKDLYAAPAPRATPSLMTQLPLDVQLDMLKRANEVHETTHDTITIVRHDTVHTVKYKTKYRVPKKSVEPDTLPKQAIDTLYVPSLKVKMQMGEKELMDTIITLGPALCV